MQYALRPAPPNPFPLDDDDELETGRMSPRTAMLAGLVLGLTVMIGIVGAFAWRQQQQTDADTPPASATGPRTTPPPSSASTAVPSAEPPKADAAAQAKADAASR